MFILRASQRLSQFAPKLAAPARVIAHASSNAAQRRSRPLLTAGLMPSSRHQSGDEPAT
jgi:hypothetical protein